MSGAAASDRWSAAREIAGQYPGVVIELTGFLAGELGGRGPRAKAAALLSVASFALAGLSPEDREIVAAAASDEVRRLSSAMVEAIAGMLAQGGRGGLAAAVPGDGTLDKHRGNT